VEILRINFVFVVVLIFCVLLQLANEFWSDAALRQKRPFNPQIVEDVYQKEMVGTE
jgi:hypothetical protein